LQLQLNVNGQVGAELPSITGKEKGESQEVKAGERASLGKKKCSKLAAAYCLTFSVDLTH